MGPGGCDKTQEMIDEWNEQTKGLFEEEDSKRSTTEVLRDKYERKLL